MQAKRATLRDGLPDTFKLSFGVKLNHRLTNCSACAVSMTKSVYYMVEGCECLICDSCSNSFNGICPACGNESSTTSYDEAATNELRSLLTVTDETTGWSGTFKEAKKRVKEDGGGGGAGTTNSLSGGGVGADLPSTPNTNGELLVYDNDGLIPATEEPYQTHVFWDYDNIQAPKGEANFVKFYTSIVKSLEKKYLMVDDHEGGKRVIYSRHFVDCKICVGGKHPAREELKEQAGKLNAHVLVAGTKKEAADRVIESEVKKLLDTWRDDFEDEDTPIPHNIIIISNDLDFASSVENCDTAGVDSVWVHSVNESTEHYQTIKYHAANTFQLSSLVNKDLLPIVEPPAQPTTPASKLSSRQPTLEEQLSGSQPNTPLTAGSGTTAATIAKKVSSANAAVANSKQPAAAAKKESSAAAAETKKEHVPQRVVATSKGSKEVKEDKTYPVDGSYVLESLLIRNRALDYLDQYPYRSGKKCTNPREHDIQDCSFIHFRRNPNSRRR